ncbi:hypothetical protein ACFLIM_38945 [Nonomuraea sp. M3C6]|uniref:Uncharacterized protein n=1 Tax=Nonomuraea marmarensis TaxID=3351344 RepID=A0ABW7AP86_9ACTN
MKVLIYVLVGVLLGLATLALLFWGLASAQGQDDRIVQQDNPGPVRYLQVGRR